MTTIDLTPTWEQILPTLLVLFKDGNAKGRAAVTEELTRMAKLADLYVAERTREPCE
jgi:hypothetical protein